MRCSATTATRRCPGGAMTPYDAAGTARRVVPSCPTNGPAGPSVPGWGGTAPTTAAAAVPPSLALLAVAQGYGVVVPPRI